MKILVTGAAGFIGAALSDYLLKCGHEVVGIDNLNDYYDVQLKRDRLAHIQTWSEFKNWEMDITDFDSVLKVFRYEKPEVVVHLAAQAGVRYSIEQPQHYIDTNVTGFLNILESCVLEKPCLLLYASSSSVYGNGSVPSYEIDETDSPESMYAATKKMNELMAHAYKAIYGINSIGLRFFTVYGEWGRPDMALFKFVQNIMGNVPLSVFNNGQHERSFTYIGDVIAGISGLLTTFLKDPAVPYSEVMNIGGAESVKLMDYIKMIEEATGKEAIINFLPLQAGDVEKTQADCTKINAWTGYIPQTDIKTGISKFVEWYKHYYGA